MNRLFLPLLLALCCWISVGAKLQPNDCGQPVCPSPITSDIKRSVEETSEESGDTCISDCQKTGLSWNACIGKCERGGKRSKRCFRPPCPKFDFPRRPSEGRPNKPSKPICFRAPCPVFKKRSTEGPIELELARSCENNGAQWDWENHKCEDRIKPHLRSVEEYPPPYMQNEWAKNHCWQTRHNWDFVNNRCIYTNKRSTKDNRVQWADPCITDCENSGLSTYECFGKCERGEKPPSCVQCNKRGEFCDWGTGKCMGRKRSVEETSEKSGDTCISDCRKTGLSWNACIGKCERGGKRSIEEASEQRPCGVECFKHGMSCNTITGKCFSGGKRSVEETSEEMGKKMDEIEERMKTEE